MVDQEAKFPDFIDQFSEVKIPGSDAKLRVVGDSKGQVSFVRMSQASSVGLHSHDASWAMLVSGEMSVIMGDETFIAKAGDSWFVPKGVIHGGEALKESQMIEIFCEQRFNLET